MEIKTELNGKELTVAVCGKIDSATAPQLETTLKDAFVDIDSLIFDFAALDYMSSAGLRVLLGAQKKLNAAKGKMLIKNCNETLMKIFEVTGMSMIFTFE